MRPTLPVLSAEENPWGARIYMYVLLSFYFYKRKRKNIIKNAAI